MRLRLVQIRDRRVIEEFLASQGIEGSELRAERLVRADPRARVAICATALLGLNETVLGVGSMAVNSEAPDLLVVDHEITDGLEELLTRALRARTAVIAERNAA